MSDKKENNKESAHFQSGHRQSNTHDKMDMEVTPKGDGSLSTESQEEKDKKEIRKTVDDILDGDKD